MNVLLFLVFPIATIIFSIALQKILKCPILVAGIVFAIFLILAFTVYSTDFLIYVILYTIISYITAYLTNLFCNFGRNGLQNLSVRNISSQTLNCTQSNCDRINANTLSADRLIQNSDENNGCCCNRSYRINNRIN